VIISPFTISGSTIAFSVAPGISMGFPGSFAWSGFAYTLTINAVPIPEPGTGLLLIGGLLGFCVRRRMSS
jgi:hypothetical protein